ncbi:MAG: hypothetical protein HYZ28_24075 [Myxococcales bacterium]|nr:hypothetical protein [Myxococcales bacterium]
MSPRAPHRTGKLTLTVSRARERGFPLVPAEGSSHAPTRLDVWVQRVTAAAMVAMAAALVGVGLALYSPGARSGPPQGPETTTAQAR